MVTTDAALLVELLRRELLPLVRQAVRDELRHSRDTCTPAQRAVLAAVARVYGAAEQFTASSLADAARFDPEARQGLLRACNADTQRLGILLGQISECGVSIGGMRLVRLPKEAGVRRWALEAVESL